MRKWLVYILTLFFVFELLSKLFLGAKTMERLIGWNDEWRFKVNYALKNKQKGEGVNQVVDMYDATKGWRLIPNQKEEYVYGNKTLTTNSKGIRGTQEYSYQKPDGGKRIVCIGDSFTLGEEVSDWETYPHHLEKMMPDAEVINMGVHGYGLDQTLLYLQEEGIKYKPDWVVLGFVADDVNRSMYSYTWYLKPYFELGNDGMLLQNVPVPKPETIKKQHAYRSTFLLLLHLLWHNITTAKNVPPRIEEEQKMAAAILNDMIKTVKSINAKPLICFIPTPYRYQNPSDIYCAKEVSLEEFVGQYCHRKNISYVSLTELFTQKIKNKEIGLDHMHWQNTGNELIAKALKNKINGMEASTAHNTSKMGQK